MKRRQLIKSIALASTFAVTGSASYVYLTRQQRHQNLSIEAIVSHLRQVDTQTIASIGEWQPAKIFVHCAQSIEFSMMGYPQHKSQIFKRTVGPLAFAVFSSMGKMKHDLAEAIPGADSVELTNNQMALNRLIESLKMFNQFKGKLAPHFAFGELSKMEYTLAHVMHINNHFDELVV